MGFRFVCGVVSALAECTREWKKDERDDSALSRSSIGSRKTWSWGWYLLYQVLQQHLGSWFYRGDPIGKLGWRRGLPLIIPGVVSQVVWWKKKGLHPDESSVFWRSWQSMSSVLGTSSVNKTLSIWIIYRFLFSWRFYGELFLDIRSCTSTRLTKDPRIWSFMWRVCLRFLFLIGYITYCS